MNDKDQLKIIGQRIKELRESENLTKVEFGKKFGVSSMAVAHYENGTNGPKIHTAAIIATHYGVSLDWLYGRTDKREPRPTPTLTQRQREAIQFYDNYLEADGKDREVVDLLLNKKRQPRK